MGGNLLRKITPLALATLLLIAGVAKATEPPLSRAITFDHRSDAFDEMIVALAERQRTELGIPERYFPFLVDDAKVKTGRDLFGSPAPDLDDDSIADVLETDLRYSYGVGEQQGPLPTVESEVDTRVTVRRGTDGKKIWTKRFDRDAWPMSMRLGDKGEPGVLVVTNLWTFYGSGETSTIGLDAYAGKTGKHLWSREYTATSYWDLPSSINENNLIMLARFEGLPGKAQDLLAGFATTISAVFSTTIIVRTLSIDGGDGTEHPHPIVDVGINWWPIPWAMSDLDGDGLDDFVTTNNLGLDTGGDSQEPPAVGGTVYARTGSEGTPIWTTSGLQMTGFAFAARLPDVVADPVADVGLMTYVPREESLLPSDVLPISFLGWKERVYLFEGHAGGEIWHKPWEWMLAPGDIDADGRSDLILTKFGASFQKGWTKLDQLAVKGTGEKIWSRTSKWHFEVAPCPKGLCYGGWGYGLNWSPDVQPDGVKDLHVSQSVSQNGAFDDSINQLFDGSTGRLRFDEEDDIQPVDVAIDGRGTDFTAYKVRNNRVSVSARDGWNHELWSGSLGGPDKLLPRDAYFWAQGFHLPGDVCGDLVITGFEDNESFYGVFDGGDGHLIWFRWTGVKNEHPTFTERTDSNEVC